MTMEKKLFVVAVVAMMAAVTVYAQEANKVDAIDRVFYVFVRKTIRKVLPNHLKVLSLQYKEI